MISYIKHLTSSSQSILLHCHSIAVRKLISWMCWKRQEIPKEQEIGTVTWTTASIIIINNHIIYIPI